ncbi:unnamed protein product [Closterium sp. NIES-64]|nr:unnamed protein product [Closterium sp. NIES-64]
MCRPWRGLLAIFGGVAVVAVGYLSLLFVGHVQVAMSGSVERDCWQWGQGGGNRFGYVARCHVRDLRLFPLESAHWPRPAADSLDHQLPRFDATACPQSPAAEAFALMATEAEKSAVDQGHTAEGANAPPPAPAADVADAAAPLIPPAPPAVDATSAHPLPLSPAPLPSLPHVDHVSGAPAPVAQPSPGAQPSAQAVAGGPAQVTAVGAGPGSAHFVGPLAAPVNPVAQRPAGSQMRAAGGVNAAAHRGRGSPRRRPSSSYRSAHRGGRGGWWGGHGRGGGGPSEMQQLREDFPGMLAAAMRNALNGAPSLGGSPAHAAPAPAPPPVNAQDPPAPLATPAPPASAYPRAPGLGGDRAPPAFVRPVSASQYPPLPWIPPLPDTGFVGAGGGAARGPFVPPRRVPPLKELSKEWGIDIVNGGDCADSTNFQVIRECDDEGFIPNVNQFALQHHSRCHHQPHTTRLPVSHSPCALSFRPLPALSLPALFLRPLSALPAPSLRSSCAHPLRFDTIPDVITNLTRLIALVISQVDSGTIPASFGNMTSLQEL